MRGGLDSTTEAAASGHMGPLIPPSLRTRQKWIMISSDAASRLSGVGRAVGEGQSHHEEIARALGVTDLAAYPRV